MDGTATGVAYEVVRSHDAIEDDKYQVEGIDYDREGIIYFAQFLGHEAKARAEEYAAFKNTQQGSDAA